MSNFDFNFLSQANVNSFQTGNRTDLVNRNVGPLLTAAQNSTDKSEVSAMLLLDAEWEKSEKLYGPTLQESAEKPPEGLFSAMLENCFHKCGSSGKTSSAVLDNGAPHSLYIAVCSLVLHSLAWTSFLQWWVSEGKDWREVLTLTYYVILFLQNHGLARLDTDLCLWCFSLAHV